MKKKVYDIFISYRREGGIETARHLNDLLIHDHYNVSFDIDTLRSGDFDAELLKRIDECTDFVLILNKGALDRCVNTDKKQDWLRNELAYALEKKKNIIPVMLDGFTEFPENLPADIAQVATKNAPKYDQYYFDDFYRKLKKDFLQTSPKNPNKNHWRWMVAVVLVALGISIALTSRYTLNQPFTATVRVHGWKGKNHFPLQGNGTIVLILGDKIEKTEINKQGEAIFKSVSAEYANRPVRIAITDTQGEPYYLPDSILVLRKKEINYIEAKLKGLDCLRGEVLDADTGEGIPGAGILVAGIETTTDEYGRFQVNLPAEKQEKEQEITISKESYTGYRKTIPMMGENLCRIILERNEK